MPKGRQVRDRKTQKELELRRRLKKRRERNPSPLVKQTTPKLTDEVSDAYDLIHGHKYAEAEQLLDRLNNRYDGYPAVVEAQLCLYQTTENHECCCRAAKQLAKLTPRDPHARLMYAQESMFCGRVGIALANYQLFLERWPAHANAQKARNAMELVEPECEDGIQRMGFEDAGLELLVIHEEVLECVQNGQFDYAAAKCLELLKRSPDCASARNNLALAYFQTGKIEKAVHVAEETFDLAPDNRFAAATLGKLRFLNGQEDEAHAIADRIVANPPSELDPLAATIEFLSFLGRDENIVVISEAALVRGIENPRCKAMVLHHLAVAQCRLGDEKAARSSWKSCLKAMPRHVEARQNLDDLNSGQGHAPWAESVVKWISRPVCHEMSASRAAIGATGHFNLTEFPAVAALIPALLDRGDPMGREMAMKMAAADGSREMLDALQEFAFGSRGPDSMRHEALNVLGRAARVDSGPHRFYSRGKWTDVKLFMAEINCEPTPCASPQVQALYETGTEALRNGDYALAEDTFHRILDHEPDNCGAAYNLCVVWLERDGKSGRRRAQARMEEIHEHFPDYLFAPISLAQCAAMDGDLDRATELLEPIIDAKKLDASEAVALFMAQIQIAVKRREFDSAEQTLAMLVQIAGEDDPKVASLRRIIDRAAGRRGLSRLRSWVEASCR